MKKRNSGDTEYICKCGGWKFKTVSKAEGIYECRSCGSREGIKK